MKDDANPDLAARVDPADMLRFVQARMLGVPVDAGGSPQVRAAQLRWDALNRAFGDARVSPWNLSRRRDQIHVPAALIAAAGVAPLKVAADEVVFDIPTLLDATLELCEPLGHG
jgi:hypothetical protein